MKQANESDINKGFVVRKEGRTSSNGLKRDKFRFTKDIGKKWLTDRVVDEWNRPDSHVMSASATDKWLDRQEMVRLMRE